MAEITDNADHTPKRSNVKRWCAALSILYVAAYCWLFRNTEICDAMQYPVNLLPDRYLACRSISELGDALAGLFAPLAFLWLVGAVLIQSEELDDTREVMKKQLAVAEQQVQETKASTELFREQTEILKADRLDRLEQKTNKEFDEALVFFSESARSLVSDLYVKYYAFSSAVGNLGEPLFQPFSLRIFPHNYDFKDVPGTLNHLIKTIQTVETNHDIRSDDKVTLNNESGLSDLILLRSALKLIVERIPRLSSDYKVRAKTLRLEYALESLNNFISAIEIGGK